MDTLFTGLRVVVSLGAVLGLLWVIHRKVSKSGRVSKSAKHVTVVARQGISGKASVAVVDVEGVRYVLGVTEHAVNVLSTGQAPADARVTALAPVAAPLETVVAPAAPSFEEALDLEQRRQDAPAVVVADAPAFDLPLAGRAHVGPASHVAVPALGSRRAARATRVPTPPYRRGVAAASTAAPRATPAAPLAGSILSASTWKQAAAAMRSQKRA
ncbi:FliO/MopB family protein [Frondihabitans cladoniiphilus]|uniref:Flagellar protein n=1 Tax=Frondihabitans cladoniiphilus TaxID=715785 RepID=A0ABP8VWZ7_9MICO